MLKTLYAMLFPAVLSQEAERLLRFPQIRKCLSRMADGKSHDETVYITGKPYHVTRKA